MKYVLILFVLIIFLLANPVKGGDVSIVASGYQSYYLGEDITFSGTNTDTETTYLFITGPNLPANGAQIDNLNPGNARITNGIANSFKEVQVNSDNTWSWKWDTYNVALDAGKYTVYAVSYPRDINNLAGVRYGTVSITIKKPFIEASLSRSVLSGGDTPYIESIARGCPSSVQIWILGLNYVGINIAPVGPDCSFQFTIPRETMENLQNGQYFVIVQHPMQNNRFDIVRSTINPNLVLNLQTGTSADISSQNGLEAAGALMNAINDPNVDDTYTGLKFLVEHVTLRTTAQPTRDVRNTPVLTTISGPSNTDRNNQWSIVTILTQTPKPILYCCFMIIFLTAAVGINYFRKVKGK